MLFKRVVPKLNLGGYMKKILILLGCLLALHLVADNISIVTGSQTYSFDLADIENITFSGDVSVDEMQIIVNSVPIKFLKNYPNPFNPCTTISFELAQAGMATLEIFNVKGQKVNTLINEELAEGVHEVIWNGKDVSGKKAASGVYFYSLNSQGESKIKKMIVLK